MQNQRNGVFKVHSHNMKKGTQKPHAEHIIYKKIASAVPRFLGHNIISDNGAKALADALRTNTTLTNLKLEKENIPVTF